MAPLPGPFVGDRGAGTEIMASFAYCGGVVVSPGDLREKGGQSKMELSEINS